MLAAGAVDNSSATVGLTVDIVPTLEVELCCVTVTVIKEGAAVTVAVGDATINVLSDISRCSLCYSPRICRTSLSMS